MRTILVLLNLLVVMCAFSPSSHAIKEGCFGKTEYIYEHASKKKQEAFTRVEIKKEKEQYFVRANLVYGNFHLCLIETEKGYVAFEKVSENELVFQETTSNKGVCELKISFSEKELMFHDENSVCASHVFHCGARAVLHGTTIPLTPSKRPCKK